MHHRAHAEVFCDGVPMFRRMGFSAAAAFRSLKGRPLPVFAHRPSKSGVEGCHSADAGSGNGGGARLNRLFRDLHGRRG
jgi:hypothetical protein